MFLDLLPVFCILGISLWAILHLVWMAISPYLRGIHIGKLDRDSWTRHDYRLWYSEQWTNMFPVSDREVHILTIVQGYEKYGR